MGGGGARPAGAGHRRRASVNPMESAAAAAFGSAGGSLGVTARSVDTFARLPNERRVPVRFDGGGWTPRPPDAKGRDEGTQKFADNSVTTAKYNILTFLPKFLYTYFSRVAYMYFLLQAGLAYWEAVSPFSPWGGTLALGFVLSVGAVKEIFEDRKRQAEDRRTNRCKTKKLNTEGFFEEIEWASVRVGDVLMVQDNELFPADLACIHCSLPDQVCFIKTANLDGETNLKLKKPVDWPCQNGNVPGGASDLEGVAEASQSLEFDLASPSMAPPTRMPTSWLADYAAEERKIFAEGPSADLRSIKGFVSVKQRRGKEDLAIPLTMNEMLLRGCMLKNSGYILGVALYTGKESRIQMNTRPVPFKMGSLDGFLNWQITFIILIQLTLCVACAVGSYLWREGPGLQRYWLALDKYTDSNYESPAVFIILSFITFWILFSYLVPISLFVSMEVVKFWQTFVFINLDEDMRDPETGEMARARNSNVIEDLGRVEFVFSDKTGTLTANEMRLRMASIGAVQFATVEKRMESPDFVDLKGMEALREFDPCLAQAAVLLEKQLQGGGDGYFHAPDLPTPVAWDTYYSGPGNLDRENSMDLNMPRLAKQTFDYFLNICLCHSLVIDSNATARVGHVSYQGPSPDEVALADGARQLGFALTARTRSHLHLDFLGHPMSFKLLNVLEFDSDRKRMSVIVECPDGEILLLCKGADSSMLPILKDYSGATNGKALLEATDQNLHSFATRGLRTLVLGTRRLRRDQWEKWDREYQAAASSFEDRDALMAECSTAIERDLHMVGVCAIEDKLQDGVPEAIFTLLEAGLKVWVLTGDKQETAISIAVSCNLIKEPQNMLFCNASSKSEAEQVLLDLINRCKETLYSARHPQSALRGNLGRTSSTLSRAPSTLLSVPGRYGVLEIVIDGLTLGMILGTELEDQLAFLTMQCTSVLVCRASPSQKAKVVQMVRDYKLKSSSQLSKWGRFLNRFNRHCEPKMLGIGDGANDVALLQTCDIGIGISGKEGKQAVNNSDFAIHQFRFLVKLLLVHGQANYYRLAGMIKYSFFKNVSFAIMFLFFQFYNGYSGTALIDSITANFHNVVLTSFPILIYSTMDRPVELSTMLKYPATYNSSRSLKVWNFWRACLFRSIFVGATCFFIPYFSVSYRGGEALDSLAAAGKTMYIALLGAVTFEIALIARSWSWIFFLFVFFSYTMVFALFLILPALEEALKIPDPDLYGVGPVLYRNPSFWLQIILCYCITVGYRLVEKAVKQTFYPEDYDILSERDKIQASRRRSLGPSIMQRMWDLVAAPADFMRTASAKQKQRPAEVEVTFRPPEEGVYVEQPISAR